MKKKLSFILILVMLTSVFSFAGSGSITYAAPSSIVTNGSFQSDLTGWTWLNAGGALGNVAVMADGGYDGTKYVRITNTSSEAPNVFVFMQQNLTVKPNTKYIISLRARTNGANGCWFGGNPTWSDRFSFSKTSNGQWTRYEATIVTGSSTFWPLEIACGDVTTQLDIDYISFKEANQLENYSFESDLTNWTSFTSGGAQATFNIRTDGAYEGSKYLRITNSSGSAPNVFGALEQDIPVEQYSSYVITIRARTSAANDCWFGGGQGWSSQVKFDINSYGAWKEYKKTIITGAETNWPFIVATGNITTSLDIDKIQIEKVPVPGLTSSVMANGSFEDDKIGWTTIIAGGAQGTADVITSGGYNGNKFIRIQNNSPEAPNVFIALQQNITVKPYTKYIISLRAYTANVNYCWYGGGPGWTYRFSFSTDARESWIKYEATFETGSETIWPFMVACGDITTQLNIDDISVKEANQVENYSFERNLINWTTYTSGSAQATFTIRTDGSYDGSKYLRITNTSTLLAGRYGCLTQNIPVEPYSSYVITLRARTTGANNCWFGGDPSWGTKFPLDTNYAGWKEYKKTIVTGAETFYPFVVITENTTTSLDIDKIQIEKVEATYPGKHGKVIWYSASDNAGRAERYFRKTFSITTLPKRAMLVVNADYASKVYINGSVVNNTMGRYVPKAYDVTRYLTTGTNIVAIQVRTQGPSDFITDTNFWSKALDETLQKSERFLIADLDFDEADGTKVDKIHTDTTWKTQNTLVTGWTTASFNDSTWANAVDLGAYGEPWNTLFFGWPTDEEMEFSGLEFTTPPAADYFTVGSAKTLNLRLSSLKFRDTITSANLNYTVKNNQGTVVQSGSVTGLTFTNGIIDTSISLTPNIVGNYTIEFSSSVYTGSDLRGTYVRNMVLGGNKLSFLINDAPVDLASSFSGIGSQSIFINAPLINKQGFGWTRVGFYWDNIQLVEGGSIYWAALDNAVNTAVANNVKPIICLAYGTTWASTAPAGTPCWR